MGFKDQFNEMDGGDYGHNVGGWGSPNATDYADAKRNKKPRNQTPKGKALDDKRMAAHDKKMKPIHAKAAKEKKENDSNIKKIEKLLGTTLSRDQKISLFRYNWSE